MNTHQQGSTRNQKTNKYDPKLKKDYKSFTFVNMHQKIGEKSEDVNSQKNDDLMFSTKTTFDKQWDIENEKVENYQEPEFEKKLVLNDEREDS